MSLIERAVNQGLGGTDVARPASRPSGGPVVRAAVSHHTSSAPPPERRIRLDFAGLARRRQLAPGNLRTSLALEISAIKRALERAEEEREDRRDGQLMVLVTSANPGEGKSFLSLNLGLSYLFTESRPVLLVDADTIGAGLSRALGIAGRAGVGEQVASSGAIALGDCLLQVEGHELMVLPAGRAATAADWTSRDCQRLAQALRRMAPSDAVILIDTPPLSALPAAHFLAGKADQVLFVVGAGRSRREEIGLALAQIADQHRVSFVLNRVPGGAVIGDHAYGPRA